MIIGCIFIGGPYDDMGVLPTACSKEFLEISTPTSNKEIDVISRYKRVIFRKDKRQPNDYAFFVFDGTADQEVGRRVKLYFGIEDGQP